MKLCVEQSVGTADPLCIRQLFLGKMCMKQVVYEHIVMFKVDNSFPIYFGPFFFYFVLFSLYSWFLIKLVYWFRFVWYDAKL